MVETCPPAAVEHAKELDVAEARVRLREAACRLKVEGWVRAHPFEAVAGALAAGYITGSSPKTIQNLVQSVTPLVQILVQVVAPHVQNGAASPSECTSSRE